MINADLALITALRPRGRDWAPRVGASLGAGEAQAWGGSDTDRGEPDNRQRDGHGLGVLVAPVAAIVRVSVPPLKSRS
jgi:hypothetical protein